MAKKSRHTFIELSLITFSMELNFSRERTNETYDDPIMREQLTDYGQITVAKAHKVGDQYFMIQGSRRLYNLNILAKAGVEDPRTCKTADDGTIIRGTGKPFSMIEVDLYEGLTDHEIKDMMTDHDTVRGLSRAEVQLSIEGLLDSTPKYNEREIVNKLMPSLVKLYPPKREIVPISKDNGVDALNNWKGVIDTAKRRFYAPVKLHDLGMEVLRGKQKWPSNKEIYEGVKIFEKAKNSDTTGLISRSNPGAEFDAWYERLVDAHTPKEGELGTEGKPKSISMWNRQQVEEKVKTCVSPFANWFMLMIVRDPRVIEDAFKVVDELALKAFQALSIEDKAAFATCWKPEVAKAPEANTKSEAA